MRRIVVSLLKGGVAKSETAVSLAHGLALKGHKVLLVDTDVQAQCNDMLGVEPEKGLAELIAGWASPEEALVQARENLWLLAGGVPLAGVKMEIARREMAPEAVLDEALACYEDQFEVMVLDTAPGWDTLLVNALYCSREVVSPVSMEPVALKGLRRFEERLGVIQKYQPALELKWIVPTFVDGRVKKTARIMEQLQAEFAERLTDPIRYSVKLSEAPDYGKTIFEHDPRGAGAKGYRALVERVLRDAPRPDTFIAFQEVGRVAPEPSRVTPPAAQSPPKEADPPPQAAPVSLAALESVASAPCEPAESLPDCVPPEQPSLTQPSRTHLASEPAPFAGQRFSEPEAEVTPGTRHPQASSRADQVVGTPPAEMAPCSPPMTASSERTQGPKVDPDGPSPLEAVMVSPEQAPSNRAVAGQDQGPPWTPEQAAGEAGGGLDLPPREKAPEQGPARPLAARLQRQGQRQEDEPAPPERKVWDLRQRFKKTAILSQRLTKGLGSGSR